MRTKRSEQISRMSPFILADNKYTAEDDDGDDDAKTNTDRAEHPSAHIQSPFSGERRRQEDRKRNNKIMVYIEISGNWAGPLGSWGPATKSILCWPIDALEHRVASFHFQSVFCIDFNVFHLVHSAVGCCPPIDLSTLCICVSEMCSTWLRHCHSYFAHWIERDIHLPVSIVLTLRLS